MKKIMVSEDLLRKVCRNGIDISAVEEIVERAEEGLGKSFSAETGLYYAHERLGNVTVWVSYAVEDGSIVIRDVYSHRMDIEEKKA